MRSSESYRIVIKILVKKVANLTYVFFYTKRKVQLYKTTNRKGQFAGHNCFNLQRVPTFGTQTSTPNKLIKVESTLSMIK